MSSEKTKKQSCKCILSLNDKSRLKSREWPEIRAWLLRRDCLLEFAPI